MIDLAASTRTLPPQRWPPKRPAPEGSGATATSPCWSGSRAAPATHSSLTGWKAGETVYQKGELPISL